MIQVKANGSLGQVRVDTWKSIARYLGRSPRTVQRWHREYGLPVYRLGVDTGSIFAYTEELDSWLRGRNRNSRSTLVEMPKPSLFHTAQFQPESDRSRTIFDPLCITGSGRQCSAALVAFAYRLWGSLSSENLKLIARSFRQAIDLDPGNAAAFAGLSHTLITGGIIGNLRIPDAYISAKVALEQAIEIDAELPEVKCAAAWLNLVWERDWQGARRRFEECLNLHADNTRAVVGLALLHIAQGAPREAAGLLREAVRHSALNAPIAALHCWSLYLAGDFREARCLAEEARASGQSGLILDTVEALIRIHCEKPDEYIQRIAALVEDAPHHDLLRGILGYALALNGQTESAIEILDAISHQTKGERSASPYPIALILTGLNEKHDAVPWLEQSFRSGSLWSLGFPSDPVLNPLRDQPGYRAFLSKACYPVPMRKSQMRQDSWAISPEALQLFRA